MGRDRGRVFHRTARLIVLAGLVLALIVVAVNWPSFEMAAKGDPASAVIHYGTIVKEHGVHAAVRAMADDAGKMAPTAVIMLVAHTAGGGLATRTGAAGEAGIAAAESESEFVNLASDARTIHILEGDATGGGHQWPGLAGKSPFPEDWSGARIMHEVSDIATDPAAWNNAVSQGGRAVLTGMRDGVRIRVIVDSQTGEIISGYPTNVARHP
jgi:hypothetical protein